MICLVLTPLPRAGKKGLFDHDGKFGRRGVAFSKIQGFIFSCGMVFVNEVDGVLIILFMSFFFPSHFLCTSISVCLYFAFYFFFFFPFLFFAEILNLLFNVVVAVVVIYVIVAVVIYVIVAVVVCCLLLLFVVVVCCSGCGSPLSFFYYTPLIFFAALSFLTHIKSIFFFSFLDCKRCYSTVVAQEMLFPLLLLLLPLIFFCHLSRCRKRY